MQWKNKVRAGFEKSVRPVFRGFLNDGTPIGFWTFYKCLFSDSLLQIWKIHQFTLPYHNFFTFLKKTKK
jgi:hypothetical protein